MPGNTGHSQHKGTPRERFIEEFIKTHLSERVAIGRGEIIDASSRPNQQRNQIDVVIYRREYPKLDFGGDIGGFFAESVVATIEVKSTLDKKELCKSMLAARNVKKLSQGTTQILLSGGHEPPGILSYVVAYRGPKKMETVYGWTHDIAAESGITLPTLPQSTATRFATACPTVDGIFVLGKGFLEFGNSVGGYMNSDTLKARPNLKWAFVDAPNGNLLRLFLFLTHVVSSLPPKVFLPGAYLVPETQRIWFGP